MKVINLENGFLLYDKIFNNLRSNAYTLVIWQIHPETGQRSVAETQLNAFNLETNLLHLQLIPGLALYQTLPLFCYFEEGQLIFKTNILEIRESVFTVTVPSEIKYLEDPERILLKGQMGIDLNSEWHRVRRLNVGISEEPLGGYMKVKSLGSRTTRDQEFLHTEFGSLSLDDEDKMYAAVRESPRARPSIDKWLKLKISYLDFVHELRLFDLSRGGLSFVVQDADLFPKGIEVCVIGIDSHELDDPLIGKVMSVRPIDESQLEWKIGIKFEDGQY
jgi:hypothetical protein